MWNRRKEEEFVPQAGTASRPASNLPAGTAEFAKEGTPMATMPGRNLDSDLNRGLGAATIGKSVTIKGQIFSREDLTVDGEVEGTIELQEHRLTVGPNGRVQAGVKAREIVVLGAIHGNVEVTDRIDIRKDAKLVGDIKTARIIIEDGAYFKGSIDIVKAEVTKPAPAHRPQQASPVVSVPGGAAPAPAPTQSGPEGKR